MIKVLTQMNRKLKFGLLVGSLLLYGQQEGFAQSNLKEGNNHFALYTKSGDFKILEKARDFSDKAYVTGKDSTSDRNNMLRSLVYSSLAVADSNRTLKYSKDPIQVAVDALNHLQDPDYSDENQQQIFYVRKNLANAYLALSRKSLSNNKYEEALEHLQQVDRYNDGALQVKHNLAVISRKLGKTREAIQYYKAFMEQEEEAKPAYYLVLSKMYLAVQEDAEALNTLQEGRDRFPDNREILFSILNVCADNGSYTQVASLIDEAIEMEPDNVALNYLAGYANEVVGDFDKAYKYYKRVVKLDENNYKGNLELGLLYLKEYLQKQEEEKEINAQKYLLKANEIDPNAENALKSLAILFEQTGNSIQLERVQNQLNQNTF